MRDRLLAALDHPEAPRADIRFERGWQTVVLGRGGDIAASSSTSWTGALVRAMAGGCAWGSATCTDPDQLAAGLQQALERSFAYPLRPAPALPALPARQGAADCPPELDPRGIPLSRKRDLARRVAEVVRAADRRIVDCRVRYEDLVVERWVATSDGSCLYEVRPEVSLAVLAVAEEDGTVERALDSIAVPGDWAALERWVDGVARVALRVVELLRATPWPGGRLPAVLDPRLAGLLAHRVAGHLCAADDRADGRAPLALGTRVGPDLLTIGDDGCALGLRGTAAFDQEGVSPRNTVLIQHGAVVGHLHTRTSAAAAGAAPTGNARAAELEPPLARPTNTYVANGTGDLTALLADIPDGLYLADPAGVCLDDGRLTLRAGYARRIRHGQLGEPVKGVALAGDAHQLLGLVDRVAGDFVWTPAAARCARDGAGAVPVGTGAPHLRLLEAPLDATA